MNDHLLVEQIAPVLIANAPLLVLIPTISADQSGAVTPRPSLVLSGEYTNYGERRMGTMMFELRSRIGDETADREHQARFMALFVLLLGAQGADRATTLANQAAAKTAFKASVAAGGKVSIADYGPAANAINAGAEGEDLRTVLSLRVAWAFTPPV